MISIEKKEIGKLGHTPHLSGGRTLSIQRMRISHTPQPSPFRQDTSLRGTQTGKKLSTLDKQPHYVYTYTLIILRYEKKKQKQQYDIYINLHIYKTTLQQNTRRVDRTC